MSATIVRLGFTGTHKTPTIYQLGALGALLDDFIDLGEPVRGHHGGCVGADAAFHEMCTQRGMFVVLHPPKDSRKQQVIIADEVRPRYPYLVRNHHIVGATDLLIAVPGTIHEVLRSGTWATVRYARKIGRRVIIILPQPQDTLSN